MGRIVLEMGGAGMMQDSEGLQLVGPPVAEPYDIFKNAPAFH